MKQFAKSRHVLFGMMGICMWIVSFKNGSVLRFYRKDVVGETQPRKPKQAPAADEEEAKKQEAEEASSSSSTANSTVADAGQQTITITTKTTTNDDANNKNSSSRVVVATFVFGKKYVEQRRFRMFVKTAQYSGFDFVIVGDHVPPFLLPDNVRHFLIDWNELVDRLYQNVLDGNIPNPERLKVTQEGQAVPIRKLCDFKHLMAELVPEIVQGYNFWGHCDNDILLGNLTKFFNDTYLEQWDIISGSGHRFAWGPFMLYRNNQQVNRLYRQAELPLEQLYAATEYLALDEWATSLKEYYPSSMAGIIKTKAGQLGLRHTRAGIYKEGNIMNDNAEPCKEAPLDSRCGECEYRQGRLKRWRDGKELYLCHYIRNKDLFEQSLQKNETLFLDLLERNEFRYTWKLGFDYIFDESNHTKH